MRTLIIHIPKGFSSEDWSHNYINLMPMGVFSLAHYAQSRGHYCKATNAAVFENKQRALEHIFGRIEKEAIDVVGLTLHWHLSGYDVCYAAKQIKDRFPECTIVLGGITATVFAGELLDTCDVIDMIVRGDGEVPLADLLDQLDLDPTDRNFEKIPNLSWRKETAVIANEQAYVATDEALSSYNFSLDGVLDDVHEYANLPSMFGAMAGKSENVYQQPINERLFFLNIGRGCSLNCVYCAGSNVSYRKYFNRNRVTIRSVDAVLKTVRYATEAGFRKFHICFDPPFSGKDGHFDKLFRRTAAEIDNDLMLCFECYNLPTERFLDACASSFSKTIMIISPCFFDSEKMVRYKGYRFTRSELETCLEKVARYDNIDCFVYFAITPLEPWDSDRIYDYVVYMKTLKRNYGCQVSAMPIYAEPGSPWISINDKFPGTAVNLGFSDFYKEWQKPLDSWNGTLCNLPNINDIFDEIGKMMENESIP